LTPTAPRQSHIGQAVVACPPTGLDHSRRFALPSSTHIQHCRKAFDVTEDAIADDPCVESLQVSARVTSSRRPQGGPGVGLCPLPFMTTRWVQRRVSRLVAAGVLAAATPTLQAVEAGIGGDTASHEHYDFHAGEEINGARSEKLAALLPRSRAASPPLVVYGQTVTITRNRQGGVDTTVIPRPCTWIARGNQEACAACEESLSIRSPGGLPAHRQAQRWRRPQCVRTAWPDGYCSSAVPKSLGSHAQPGGL
jgi:hypothetical protein